MYILFQSQTSIFEEINWKNNLELNFKKQNKKIIKIINFNITKKSQKKSRKTIIFTRHK